MYQLSFKEVTFSTRIAVQCHLIFMKDYHYQCVQFWPKLTMIMTCLRSLKKCLLQGQKCHAESELLEWLVMTDATSLFFRQSRRKRRRRSLAAAPLQILTRPVPAYRRALTWPPALRWRRSPLTARRNGEDRGRRRRKWGWKFARRDRERGENLKNWSSKKKSKICFDIYQRKE